jgi:hypothetical protein
MCPNFIYANRLRSTYVGAVKTLNWNELAKLETKIEQLLVYRVTASGV